MTTVADMIARLSKLPPDTVVVAYDTVVVAYDADAGMLASVTGTLYNPNGKYLSEDSSEVTEGPTVELCTDIDG